jgi:hypothetical protein
MLADTGNIWKKRLVQEMFVPLESVRVRIRVPAKRQVRAVELMWDKTAVHWTTEDSWVQLTVPRIHIYEVVRVDLA